MGDLRAAATKVGAQRPLRVCPAFLPRAIFESFFGGITVKGNHHPSKQRNTVLRALPVWLCVLIVALTLPLASRAQDTGYISGTVTDKSGAAVAGAEIVLTNAGGSLTRNTTSNTDGAYVLSGLPGD